MRQHSARGALQRGFTYIWVLLVVALMGVGLVLASDVQTTASQRDREAELLAIGQQFRYALASYYQARQPSNTEGTSAAGGVATATPQMDPLGYPATLDELLKDNRFPGLRRHLRKVFVDPMTRKAEWGLVQVSGRIVGVHSLSSAVPIKQAGFDDENRSFTGAQSYAEWVFGFANQMPVQGAVTGAGVDGASADPSPTPGQGSATPQ